MQILAPRMGLLGCTTLEGFILNVVPYLVNDFRGPRSVSGFGKQSCRAGCAGCIGRAGLWMQFAHRFQRGERAEAGSHGREPMANLSVARNCCSMAAPGRESATIGGLGWYILPLGRFMVPVLAVWRAKIAMA
jgi:hypothetical protein